MEGRDDLTQLLNRGAFDSALQAAVAEALREDQPLALIFAEIDHFKRVNDTYGHQRGDLVLRRVAGLLEKVARWKGEVYRYGGEEVCLILRNHSTEEGVAVAERARRLVETEAVEGIGVSVSFGVAGLPDHATTAVELVRAADESLFDAKNRGRNLVRFHREPEPSRPGPREPQRKAPEPGRLTDQQRADLRRRVLRHESIECPDDGAYFDVHDVTTHGSVGREFMIVCPGCGLRDSLQADSR